MWKRARQVRLAWQAHITQADRNFTAAYLNLREQELFYGMSVPDQFHCLRVAKDIQRLSAGRDDVDGSFLIRCALLHDVGRRLGDVSVLDKIAAVLLHCLMPSQAKAWGHEGKGTRLDNLRHALYVYFNHPRRSVVLLREIGAEGDMLKIVGAHHQTPGGGDSAELQLLRQADELN